MSMWDKVAENFMNRKLNLVKMLRVDIFLEPNDLTLFMQRKYPMLAVMSLNSLQSGVRVLPLGSLRYQGLVCFLTNM